MVRLYLLVWRGGVQLFISLLRKVSYPFWRYWCSSLLLFKSTSVYDFLNSLQCSLRYLECFFADGSYGFLTGNQNSKAVAQRCSVKKVFLEISQNSQENTCARVSLLKKKLWQMCFGLRPANLWKKRLWHRCFLVNFTKFPKTTFLQNTSGGCFWKLATKSKKILFRYIFKLNILYWSERPTSYILRLADGHKLLFL